MLNRQYTKIQLSQKYFWENFKITDHKYRFWILKVITFLVDILYSVKLLSNHEATLRPKNVENISNFFCVSNESQSSALRLRTDSRYSQKNQSIIKGKRKNVRICRIFEYRIIPGALVVHLILIFPFPSASQPCSSGFSGFWCWSSAVFYSYGTLFAHFKCRYNASCVVGRRSGANNPFLNTL